MKKCLEFSKHFSFRIFGYPFDLFEVIMYS